MDAYFTLDDGMFNDLNTHAINEIRLDPNSELITLTACSVKYPDDWISTVNCADSFQIPKYSVLGVTSFTAHFLVTYTLNGATYETQVGSLAMTQDPVTPA